jgi:hypothetical protein
MASTVAAVAAHIDVVQVGLQLALEPLNGPDIAGYVPGP